MGLLIPKGFASLLGMKTPVLDKLLLWVEKVTGKTYLDENLNVLTKGEAVMTSRAPQAYGYKSVEEILRALESKE